MKEITQTEVGLAAKKLAVRLETYMINRHIVPLNIYGVPRGGVVAAYVVMAQSEAHIRVVDDPKQADVIIDDIIDSGNTKATYALQFPNKPFMALYEDSNEWLVFPWEQNDEENGGDTIATRLLQYIEEDVHRTGLKETPKRFLKAWKDFTSGYGVDPAEVLKVFDDGAEQYDEMVLVKDIPVYSQCEHHLVPFFGVAHIAYIPNGRIVGLSKLSRIVDIFSKRLQVQERLTVQIADTLNEHLNPNGVAVVLECRHLCMEARGIQRQGSTTITSAMYGVFKDNPETRAEFMSFIK